MAQEIFYGYRDIAFNPEINNLGDISTVTDTNAIKQSLTNIVRTSEGERLMLPGFGASVRDYLFEPLDEETAMEIGKSIEYSIKEYEPRINLEAIDVTVDFENDGYEISVQYSIVQLQTFDSVTVTLQRL